MRFSKYDIDTNIKKAIDELGFHKTTDIQYRVIPAIMRGDDVMAIAQTGTGKTAAFVIPIIQKILLHKKHQQNGPQCLTLVPTRELALQIEKVYNQISKYVDVSAMAIIGGLDQDPQIEKLKKGTDIIISTPGRMFDFLNQGHLTLNNVNTLVLDEADLMLDLGFHKDIQDVLGHLKYNRQTLFFSATIDKKIKKLAYNIVSNPIRIELSPKDPVSKNIDHWKIAVSHDDKRFFLERLINEFPDSKVMVFVRTKVRSERVQKAMERVDISSTIIHGDLEQELREETLDIFKKGEEKILIATDVTARGIDIPNVDIVVNYDLPEDPEYYVHRIGRTGRGKNKGQAFSFVSELDKELIKEIEEYIYKPVREIKIDDQLYKNVLNTPNENEISMDDIIGLIDQNENWKKK